MLYNELLDRLQNLTNRTPSQSELIKILNIKQSTMSERAKRNSKFSPKEISILNDYYGINLYTSSTKLNINLNEKILDDENSQGKRLQKIRKILNLNQLDLCKLLNLSQQAISNIEEDKIFLHNEDLIILGKKLNINIDYLLIGRGSMFIKNSSNIKDNIKQSLKEMFLSGELDKEFFQNI